MQPTKRGLDISSMQGVVDWGRVKQEGIDFAILKCTQGNEPGRDGYFSANISGARTHGIAVGAYHFAYPLPGGRNNRSPKDQAKRFFDMAQGVGSTGDLPPALDLEWPTWVDFRKWDTSGAEIVLWALSALDEIAQAFNRAPLLYTYPDYWRHLPTNQDFSKYPLWLADYSSSPGPTGIPPWGSSTLRQTSGGGGRLPSGVPVDEDAFYGDEKAWAGLLGMGEAGDVDVTDGGQDNPVYKAP